MKKLKILIVTQYFWPETFKINDLAKYFANKGHEIIVLTGIPNYPKGRYYNNYGIFKNRKENYQGIKIFRSFVIPRGSGSKFLLFINYLSFAIFSSIKVFSIRKNFDIIFVYEPSPITVGIPAIIKKRINNIPIIFWVTDIWPESVTALLDLPKIFKDMIYNMLNPIVKLIYKESDKILVTSEGFKSSILDKSIALDKIEYFPQWAEKIFKPIQEPRYLLKGIPKNSFKVMFAGNIGETQDFPSIIKTAFLLKNNKDIHWIILGEGRKLDWVKDKISDYGLEKCFHLYGRFSIEEMPEFYANADAMMFSMKDNYIFSITIPAKLQSYLACGKPILAMISGEAAKIVDKANAGLTCTSGDSVGLANNITKMSKMSTHQLQELGNNSLDCYKKYFDRDILFNKAEHIFSKTINSIRK